MNNFIKNITKTHPEIIQIFTKNKAEFTKIETSQRGGGKSVYIYFDDLFDDNYEYSVRISDHECSDYSYTNVLKLLTKDGEINIDNKKLKNGIIKKRLEYGVLANES